MQSVSRARTRLARQLRVKGRAFSASAQALAVLGLRAEDPARKWERRAALDPTAVAELVKDGHEVLVEKCAKRAIGNDEYAKVRGGVFVLAPLIRMCG